MRWLYNVGVLVVSVFLGYAVAIIVSSPVGIEPSHTPTAGSGADRSEPTHSAPDTTVPPTTPVPTAQTYLVWSTGGLTTDLIDVLAAEFAEISILKGDTVELEVGGDGVVPLDAVAVDPLAHRPFDPTGSLASLRPGTLLLGATSAQIRQKEPGDVLDIGGTSFEVAGITPDETVGAAEIVFSIADPNSPVETDRFALVSTDLPRPEFERLIRSQYDGPAPLRIRAEGETPWLRHGDAVLPQVFIKQALGEFSYTNRSGSEFVQNGEFLEKYLVETDVPILGPVFCHRVVTEKLVGAMTQLVEEGLAYLVDPASFRGCWNPRFIRSANGTPAGVSRHAWGAAVDLNAPSNPVGSVGTQDPRLIAIMFEWGFTWGGDWLVPDPMHFEYGADAG